MNEPLGVAHETVPSTCPWCGKRFDRSSGVEHNKAPEVGDVTICIRCAGVCVMDGVAGAVVPRLPRRADVESWSVEQQVTIARVKQAIKKMQSAFRGKGRCE